MELLQQAIYSNLSMYMSTRNAAKREIQIL